VARDEYFKVLYEHATELDAGAHEALVTFVGEIRRYVFADDRFDRAGTIELTILRPHAAEEHDDSLYELADGDSADLGDVVEALFGEDGELDREATDGCSGRDVLYLESMSIEPAYQRRNLGLHVADHAMRLFGPGCAIAALHPAPLLAEEGVRREEAVARLARYWSRLGFKQLRDTAVARLARYWSRLGFKQLRDTGVYTLDLAYTRPKPPRLLARPRVGSRAARVDPGQPRTRH